MRLTRAHLAPCLVVLASVSLLAQGTTRRVATVEGVLSHPGFYHLQAVLLRGEIIDGDTPRPGLTAGDRSLRLLTRERVPSSGQYEVRGEVLDVGRLTPEDPRFTGVDLRPFGVDPTDRWPRAGEIVLLRATGFEPAEPLTAPSIRTLALDPQRYEQQRVTVAGQFRGRNLYGDLPLAPAAASEKENRGEFVLKSADATIWVLGKRPRGRGFALDPESRIDTKRWLEVSGTVRHARGIVWIEAQEITETQPRQEQVRAETAPEPAPLIPPEVRFSVPTEGETDVPPNARVRIQFSRDLDPQSIKGRVRVSYMGAESAERGEAQAPGVQANIRYDQAARVMEISFSQPLERFRTVTVELLEGIVGTDGAPLAPWKLTFSVGG